MVWLQPPPCIRWMSLSLGLCACSGGEESEPVLESARLESGVLARVGSESLASSFVAEVAAEHRVTPELARDFVVRDALFAQAARERFRGSGVVEVARRAAHSRALLDELGARAKREGPVTEAELRKIQAKRWMDFDRPVSVATVHALVRSGPENQVARELAERIATATAGAKGAKQFMTLAKRVSAGGLNVVVEQLPFMTPDGRAVYLDPSDPRRQRTETFSPTFAKAAHAIAQEGGLSGVVETSFGYHVIMLLERVEAERYTLSELGSRLHKDVLDERARRGLQALTARLQQTSHVELAPNWEELTEQASKRP